MAHTTPIAVVTGSNKGIGFAIVRALCKQFKGTVYLTARNEALGQKAIQELEQENLHPKFHQLDITDTSSIQRLQKYLADTYGGVDLVVHNAGIAFKSNDTTPFSEQAEVTLRTNYFGTLNCYQALQPLLRPHARVVFLSSFVSQMAYDKCAEQLKSQLKACTTVDDVTSIMNKFTTDVKAGRHLENGWPDWAYGVSKIGVSLLTPILQRQLDADSSRPDIVINSADPGYVDTDMSSHKGSLTIDEGAETPVYCALLPKNVTSPRGEYLVSKKAIVQVL